MIKSILRKLAIIFLLVFIVAQFFGPEKNQGNMASIEPFLAETNPPDDVKMILKTACFDCHSDVTRYPWYNNVTPINYWLDGHIRHGKGEFNISKWNDYSAKKKDHKLEELAEEVEEGHMPLPSYTWTHKDAILTQKQKEAVEAWVERARIKYVFEDKPE